MTSQLYDLQKRLETAAHREALLRAQKEVHGLQYFGRQMKITLNKQEISVHSSELADQVIAAMVGIYTPAILEKKIDELLTAVESIRELEASR